MDEPHFELVDKENRVFRAVRETYTGRGGWRRMGNPGPLGALVQEIIPLLDSDAYFEYF